MKKYEKLDLRKKQLERELFNLLQESMFERTVEQQRKLMNDITMKRNELDNVMNEMKSH